MAKPTVTGRIHGRGPFPAPNAPKTKEGTAIREAFARALPISVTDYVGIEQRILDHLKGGPRRGN